MPDRPLFLERASFHRRRLGDAARVLPVLTMLLLLVPANALFFGTALGGRVGYAAGYTGLGVAAILWFLTWRREEVDPLAVLALGLASLVAASPAYFMASFGPGMALADTYGIGGGDHSPWAWPIYVVSALASAGLVAVVVLLLRGPAGGLGAPRRRA